MLTSNDLTRAIAALRQQNSLYEHAYAHQAECQQQIILNNGTIRRMEAEINHRNEI